MIILYIGFLLINSAFLQKTEDTFLDDNISIRHGVLKENASPGFEIELDFPIKIEKTDDICSFKIVCISECIDPPFELVASDFYYKLLLKKKLDCINSHFINIKAIPHTCKDDKHVIGNAIEINIKIECNKSVSSKMASWIKDHYYMEVIEGKSQEKIGKLEVDSEIDVCKFIVQTKSVPFNIDKDGFVFNVMILNYQEKRNYIFEVSYVTCDDKTSNKAVVNVAVKQQCEKPTWQNIPMDHTIKINGPMNLMNKNTHLNVCPACEVSHVSVDLKLKSSHSGCLVDLASILSQRRFCGVRDNSLLLMPPKEAESKNVPMSEPVIEFASHDTPVFSSPPHKVSSTQATYDSIDDNMDEKLSGIIEYIINGEKNPFLIDNLNLTSFKLGISFWMRHHDMLINDAKEQILCKSDDQGMNRHHFSLFLRNCKLILLLRQEPPSSTNSHFEPKVTPAEWRWSLDEVCDGKWHRYTVNIDFPNVNLLLDGVPTPHRDGDGVFEVINDWPLHKSNRVHDTKTAVGACWHGGEEKLVQYFEGWISGLEVLQSSNMPMEIEACMVNCKDKLDFFGVEQLDTGASISMSSDFSNLLFNSLSITSADKFIQNVKYVVGGRLSTEIGHVTMVTNVTCKNTNTVLYANTDMTVHILEQSAYVLSSEEYIHADEKELAMGVQLFKNIKIKLSDNSETPFSILKKCEIQVDPIIKSNLEYLLHPRSLAKKLMLDVDMTFDGATIEGETTAENYISMLSEIKYVVTQPHDLNSRNFKVFCTDERYPTNQIKVQVIVIHKINGGENIHGAAMENNLYAEGKQFGKLAKTNSGGTIIVVCLVGISLLGLTLAVGISRVKKAGRHMILGVDETKQDLEWDNSELNIIVNPIENEGYLPHTLVGGAGAELTDAGISDNYDDNSNYYVEQVNSFEDYDSEEEFIAEEFDEDSYYDDGVMIHKKQEGELHWDDETII